jgi:hypothetical protein
MSKKQSLAAAKTKYEKKRALMHNLFWQVPVALAVAMAAIYLTR